MSSERLTVMSRVREVDRLIGLLNDARASLAAGDTAYFELGEALTGVTRLLGWHDDHNPLGRRLLGEVGEDCDPGGPGGDDDVHLQLWSGGAPEGFTAPALMVRRDDIGVLGLTRPADLVELLAEHGLCRSPEGEAAGS